MNTENNNNQVTETPAYRLTATGRPTLVGTRKCSECGRAEFATKKSEKSGLKEEENPRYTLCKGLCVYCYCSKRNKKSGSSLSVQALELKIKYFSDLLAAKTAEAPVSE